MRQLLGFRNQTASEPSYDILFGGVVLSANLTAGLQNVTLLAQLGILELTGATSNATVDLRLSGGIALKGSNQLRPIGEWLELNSSTVRCRSSLFSFRF